jgi:putative transposase
VFYYKPQKEPDTVLEDRLRQLADRHTRWGLWKMYDYLREKGYGCNHKRVYRVYKALGLQFRRKGKKRLPARIKQALTVPEALNGSWSMDFMSDTLWNGRRFRCLNVIDDYNREILHIEIDTSLSSVRVVRVLELLIEQRGKPRKIRVDNGPEFTAEALSAWCQKQNIELVFIQPGRPMQNAYIERFNGSYRRELLDSYIFDSLKEVQIMTREWMDVYNYERPHDSLNHLSPKKYLEQNLKNSTLNLS